MQIFNCCFFILRKIGPEIVNKHSVKWKRNEFFRDILATRNVPQCNGKLDNGMINTSHFLQIVAFIVARESVHMHVVPLALQLHQQRLNLQPYALAYYVVSE